MQQARVRAPVALTRGANGRLSPGQTQPLRTFLSSGVRVRVEAGNLTVFPTEFFRRGAASVEIVSRAISG